MLKGNYSQLYDKREADCRQIMHQKNSPSQYSRAKNSQKQKTTDFIESPWELHAIHAKDESSVLQIANPLDGWRSVFSFLQIVVIIVAKYSKVNQ